MTKRTFRLRSWHFIVTMIAFFFCTLIISEWDINGESTAVDYAQFSAWDNEEGRDGLSLVFFYDDTCRFCNKMGANLERTMNGDSEVIHYYGVDINRFPHLCYEYRITAVPHLLILKDEQEVKRIMGVISAQSLKKIQDKVAKL